MDTALQNEFFNTEELEHSYYHDSGKSGYFVIAVKKPSAKTGKLKWIEEAYPLDQLPYCIEYIDPQYDSYITQAEFYTKRRKVVNLVRIGLMFVDLDTYNIPLLSRMTQDKKADYVNTYCKDNGIPLPSLIIYSGRGLQVKWILENPLPRVALPRWNALQNELINCLSELGSDRQARDASRVLRLVDTVNTKSGEYAKVLYINERKPGVPVKYNFEDLCEEVLPVSRQYCKDQKIKYEKKKKNNIIRAHSLFMTPRSLCWNRVEDLRILRELRGGTIREGSRHMYLFWSLNFLLASNIVTPRKMYYEAGELAKIIDPRWTYNRAQLSNLYERAVMHRDGEKVFITASFMTPFTDRETGI